jgi:hypothetical protein
VLPHVRRAQPQHVDHAERDHRRPGPDRRERRPRRGAPVPPAQRRGADQQVAEREPDHGDGAVDPRRADRADQRADEEVRADPAPAAAPDRTGGTPRAVRDRQSPAQERHGQRLGVRRARERQHRQAQRERRGRHQGPERSGEPACGREQREQGDRADHDVPAEHRALPAHPALDREQRGQHLVALRVQRAVLQPERLRPGARRRCGRRSHLGGTHGDRRRAVVREPQRLEREEARVAVDHHVLGHRPQAERRPGDRQRRDRRRRAQVHLRRGRRGGDEPPGRAGEQRRERQHHPGPELPGQDRRERRQPEREHQHGQPVRQAQREREDPRRSAGAPCGPGLLRERRHARIRGRRPAPASRRR